MYFRAAWLLVIFVFVAAAADAQQQDKQSVLVLDENQWVTFYDLPSRRFRSIRSAILTRDLESANRDLSVAAAYLAIEAGRSHADLQAPLQDVVANLGQLQGTVADVPLQDLDALFGRAHWLLAQHYLHFARQARDERNGNVTSLYLHATAHHIERAILWSNVAVSRNVQKTLDGLRELADELRSPATSSRAFKDRPIVRAENLLKKVGPQIDRRILIALPAVDGVESGG